MNTVRVDQRARQENWKKIWCVIIAFFIIEASVYWFPYSIFVFYPLIITVGGIFLAFLFLRLAPRVTEQNQDVFKRRKTLCVLTLLLNISFGIILTYDYWGVINVPYNHNQPWVWPYHNVDVHVWKITNLIVTCVVPFLIAFCVLILKREKWNFGKFKLIYVAVSLFNGVFIWMISSYRILILLSLYFFGFGN